MEIQTDSIQRSINIIDCLKEKARELIDTEFTFSPAMHNKQRVLSIIIKKPGITNRDLLRASKMLLKELRPITDTLEEEESIEQTGKGRSVCWWPK
jgi:hypothetical protein